MQVNGDAQYQCSPEAFVEISTNGDFVQTRFGDFIREAVVEYPQAGAVSVRGQLNPESLPARARSAVENQVQIEYDEVWTQVAPRHFQARCTLNAEAVSVSAHLTQSVSPVEWDLNQCQWALNGEYRIAIPLIGRMVEATVASHFDDFFKREHKIVDTWLKRHAGEYYIAE